MSKRIVFMLLPLYLLGCGRLVKVSDENRVYRKIYKVSMQKDEIYAASLDWLAKKFTSSREYIEVKDKNRGKIIGRGLGVYSEYFNYLVDRKFGYTITIESKDGRYRVTFDNLVVYYEEREQQPSVAKYKFEIDKIMKKLIPMSDDLYRYLTREKENIIEDKEEEW